LVDSIKSVDSPNGERLDLYLVRHGHADSRRRARDLIAAGQVLVNGQRCRKGRNVTAQDLVDTAPRAAAVLAPNPDLLLDVLYHDAELLIVNKPGLQPCHPLRGEERDTLMNAVVAHFPEAVEAGVKTLEGGLVHRLDNGTSGATIVALGKSGFARLRAALRSKAIVRSYLALAIGTLERQLQLDAPIAHHPHNRRKMMAVNDPRLAEKLKARPAMTMVAPIRRAGRFTLIDVTPRSGCRHQIRVHLAAAGFPLAGDELYGGPATATLAAGRFFLHLAEVSIPMAGSDWASARADAGGQDAIAVVAPLPADLQACVAEAERHGGGLATARRNETR
jgi:23S rRNA pseudouridine1911/1915/1917 synthase